MNNESGFEPFLVRVSVQAHGIITIVSDFPAYARFSNPRGWLKYRHALEERLQDGTVVNLMHLNSDRRRQINDEQFPKVDWEKRKQDVNRVKKLQEFLHSLTLNESVSGLSRDRFFGLLEDADKQMVKELASARIQETDVFMPRLLFACRLKRSHFRYTQLLRSRRRVRLSYDHRLISAFEDMRNRYCKRFTAAGLGT